MFIGRAALTTSPALIRSSQGSPVIGTSRATGWPRSVISIDSPAATSSRYLLACCRSSRTPIVFMCYTVAHIRDSAGRRAILHPSSGPLPQISGPDGGHPNPAARPQPPRAMRILRADADRSQRGPYADHRPTQDRTGRRRTWETLRGLVEGKVAIVAGAGRGITPLARRRSRRTARGFWRACDTTEQFVDNCGYPQKSRHYHVVLQRVSRSARSGRPLRNVGRLISGAERTFSRPSWRGGEGIRVRLGSRRRSSGPLGRRRSGRRDCGALRRRPEPPW